MNYNNQDNNKIYKVDYNRTFLNNEIYHQNDEVSSKGSKIKQSVIISIMIVCIIFLGILLIGDTEEILSNIFGKEAAITKVFENDGKARASFVSPFGMKRHNLLLLGVDDNPDSPNLWSGTRTDTIILINIDPKTKTVNAISIPRDSKVFLAGNKGVNKINAAHAIGGIELTKSTIEKTLGVKVNRYVMVHQDIVKEMVDAIGGVDIYIEKPMKYRDRTAHLYIDFQKGQQRLTGQQAVEYLRFRHDILGDIGRTQRQQWFIRSLVKTLQTPETLPKIPELVSTAKKYIKTDLSVGEMAQYAELLRNIELDKTEIAMLPGQPNQRGAVSYWILDPEKTQEVVDRLIYRDNVKNDFQRPVIATVQYAKERKNKAEALISELEAQGIEIKCTGVINKSHSQFIAHTNRITNDYFNKLNEKVQNIDKVQFVYDPVNLYCGGTDFTIIVADDKI